MALQLGMAGIFPSISYFQVPGKMSRPVWLMTGTTFIIEPLTQHMAQKAPLSFLTACHTFAPWRFMKDGAASDLIKIPPEFRKERYVTGRIFLYDEMGVSMAGRSVGVNLSAVHPTHDLALLTLPPSECDVFLRWIKERGIDRRFTLEDGKAGEVATVTGFRGRGVLGEVYLNKAEEYKKWPQEKVQLMLDEMKQIEGKQEAFTYAVQLDGPDHGHSLHGRGYSGMSGAPLLGKNDRVRGMLLGIDSDQTQSGAATAAASEDDGSTGEPVMNKTRYVSASVIREWCEGLFAPLPKLEEERLPPGDLSSIGINIAKPE